MPKVGKMQIQAGEHREEFELYYNRSQGFYLKGFNEQWSTTVQSADGMDKGMLKAYQTEADLEREATRVMRRYYEITATTKRAILVRQGYGAAVRMRRKRIGHYVGHNPNVGAVNYHSHNIDLEWAVGFEWEVVILSKGVRTTYFRIVLDDAYEEIERETYGNDLIKDSGILIDWTPARHEFFLNLERGMEKMAKAMAEFFHDSDRMTTLIDHKGYKLLNG